MLHLLFAWAMALAHLADDRVRGGDQNERLDVLLSKAFVIATNSTNFVAMTKHFARV